MNLRGTQLRFAKDQTCRLGSDLEYTDMPSNLGILSQSLRSKPNYPLYKINYLQNLSG